MLSSNSWNSSGHYTETAPSDADWARIIVEGAGGGGSSSGAQGGSGGRAVGDVSLNGGDTLEVYVGGHGIYAEDDGSYSDGGGFNGGGDGGTCSDRDGYGGGGASDVRLDGDSLGDRIIVAGGGGGMGKATGGARYPQNGGDGGPSTGATGDSYWSGGGGGGGSQSSGGAGGTSKSVETASSSDTDDGSPGSLGDGGSGGDAVKPSNRRAVPGSGGGGGYYGGGGGGAGSGWSGYDYNYAMGGGGGGGSNYVGGVENATSERGTGAAYETDGHVTIEYYGTVGSPSNVTATVDADDQITVDWDAGDSADEYHLEINRDGNGWTSPSGGPVTVSDDGSSSYSVTYIPSPDSTYDSQVGIDSAFQFRVCSENVGGRSDWTYSGTTYTTPVPPSRVSVSRPDGDTLEVTATVESDWASRLDWERRVDTGSGYGSWNNFETTGGHAKGDTVTQTYSVSSGDIQRDARYQVRVASYEYRDTDNDGNNELLESEFVHADYGNEGNVYFEDDFESGDLSNWDSTGVGNGSDGPAVRGSSHADLGISGPAEGSYYCYIDDSEHVTKRLGDLSGESDVVVKAAVASGSLDSSSEKNHLQWYDGSSWQNLRTWSHEYNRQGWIELSALVPSSYLSSDNRVRFTQFDNAWGGDHMAIDRVIVSDVLHEYTSPAAPADVALTGNENSIDATWTCNQTDFSESFQRVDYAPSDQGYNVGETPNISSDVGVESVTLDGQERDDFAVVNGEEYKVRVNAYVRQYRHGSLDGYFRTSAPEETVVTDLPAPTSLAETDHGHATVSIAWNDNHDYGDTRIDCKPTDASDWTTHGSVARNTESYTLDGLRNGEAYDIRTVARTEHAETEDN